MITVNKLLKALKRLECAGFGHCLIETLEDEDDAIMVYTSHQSVEETDESDIRIVWIRPGER